MGQPAWPEEIRVVRAMWVLQMVGELKYFIQWRAKTTCWSHVDISKLIEGNLLSLLYVSSRPHSALEVRAAARYLDTRGEYRRDFHTIGR